MIVLVTSCARAPAPPPATLTPAPLAPRASLTPPAPTSAPIVEATAFPPTATNPPDPAPSGTLPAPGATRPANAGQSPVADGRVQAATLNVTSTPPPAARLSINCFDLLDERPSGLVSSGTWLFANASNDAVYVQAGTGAQRVMTSAQESRFSFTVSPDRQRVAYRRVVRDAMRIQTIEDSLVVADAADNVLSMYPWEAGWSAVAGWLDAERLVINIAAKDGDEALAKKPATLAVLNLTTGRQKELAPDFPSLNFEYPVPNWDGWGVTMYDSTLTRVVYPFDAADRFDAGYTLWDVPGQQALAHVPAGLRSHAPRWSPDGARFVVAASEATGQSWLAFELYSAARDGGEVQRLTYLTEHYTAVYIQSYTWSPDGQQIAFWFIEEPQGVPFIEHGEARLAVLDTETGLVTNTCVPGDHDASVAPARVPPPLWSPDGAQLIVENSAANGRGRVLLVDLASEAAVVVALEVRPEGWLVE